MEALIIDDNRSTADALSQMLKVLGFKARMAYGSSAAMSILGRGFTPKFIFLDLNMPGVAGTEILKFLRREPHLVRVPVVVVTSDDQPETRTRVLKLGAKAIVIKPATIESLESALKKSNIL
ncbi:MAG TPA: response regulator [Anaerolineales bacterium]|nr:response regulator [Anaerolineales bacterium]